MKLNLKKVAKKVFGGKEEIDTILDLPLTGLRIELMKAFREKKFTKEQYDDFVSRLEKAGDLGHQAQVAKKAAEDRKVDSSLDIELNSPAKQLLWASTLTRMMDTGEEPVANSALWKQLLGSIGVNNETIAVAKVLSVAVQNDDVAFNWGEPGTWFYFDPSNNVINLDLYYSLLAGLEHAHEVQMHEIAHSQVTIMYPKRMTEIYDKIKKFVDPKEAAKEGASPAQLTEAEQKQLALDVAEWHLWMQAFNLMEDVCVDTYAVKMGDVLPQQDMGYALNHLWATIKGLGMRLLNKDLEELGEIITDAPPAGKSKDKGMLDKLRGLGKDMEEEARKKKIKEMVALQTNPLTPQQIDGIKKGNITPELAGVMFRKMSEAVLFSMAQDNNLFANKKESWGRMRIFPDDIVQLFDVSGIPEAKGKDAFEYMRALSRQIAAAQPQPKDRLLAVPPHTTVEESYRAKVRETAVQRTEVMQKVWDIYLKPFADVLMKENEKQIDQAMQQAKNGQQGQSGQGQPGQGQSGQGQPGQGQPGQPGSGQPGAGSGGGEKQDLNKDLQKQIGDMTETPEQQRDKKRQQDKDASAGNDSSNDNKDPKNGKDEKGRGGPGWGQNEKSEPSIPGKIGDLKQQSPVDENLTDEQKQELKEGAKGLPQPGNLSQTTAGRGAGIDLAKLAKGDWRDFKRRTVELAPVTNRVAEAFKNIRDEQRRQIEKMSKDHEFTPRGGDIRGRLDRDKFLDNKRRQASGEVLDLDDHKKFFADKVTTTFSTIEMTFMIDGSGSMPMYNLGNGVTAMEAALQSAVICYMAALKAGIDAYIVMWGDPKPLVIATPEDAKTPSGLKKVGERLETLRNGTGSGTSLAPGIIETVKSMAEHKSQHGTVSGSSHILVFSDGDIQDSGAAMAALETVSRKSKNLTIDVAVLRADLNGDSQTSMEGTFNSVIQKTKARLVGVLRGKDPNQIPLDLARLMLRRVRSFHVETEPDAEKRKRLKKLYRQLTG